MSRQLHLVEITDRQLRNRHSARLVAAAVLVVFFTLFVAFAPVGGSPQDTTPAVTAAAAHP